MIDLSRYVSDPAFAVTWIVIDFEGSTPAGFPAEPIEVGAVLLRSTDADLDIALNKARPWRATARAGDIYATRRVTDARSLDRTVP